MTDEELRNLVASLAISQAKTDAQLAKTDAQLAKTDAKLNKLAEMYGGVGNNQGKVAEEFYSELLTEDTLDKLAEMYGGAGNNQGKVAEEFYYNSLKHNPTLNGMQFDFIEKNVTRSKGGIEEEYDLLLVNGEDIYIIEVKYHLHPKDIDRLMGRKRSNFSILFPEYANYRIHLALATFAVDDDVKQQAIEQGITILQRRGDVIETLAA